jgi:hypothetical protein
MRSPLVAACLLFAAAPAAAQREHSDLGFQLGYSHAQFNTDASDVVGSQTGSLFGIFVGVPVAGPLSAQAEIFLATKGGGLLTVVETTPVAVSVQLVYIEVPLLARVAIPLGGPLHPNLFGGGSLALNIGCDIQTAVPGLVAQQACDEPAQLAVNTFDMGAVVGAGFEYDWRDSNARLEIRQTFGLREVSPGDPSKNRTWAILFGITL